jgi:transcriptional regulator with XRE-family HTH domain
MTLLRHVIGVALRRARQEQGKTLRDVAQAARVSVQYLSEVERGRKEASSEVLAAICAALGWTLIDLLDDVRAELVLDLTAPAPVTAIGSRTRVQARTTGGVRLAA